MRYRLRTLGGFSLLKRDEEAGDGWIDTRLGEKPCALLAYLVWRGLDVPRAALAELLWEGADSIRARNSLRQALFRIRAILGAGAVVEGREGVRLTAALEVDHPQLRRDHASGPSAVLADSQRLSTFGRSTLIRGRAFAAWCAQVRSSAIRPSVDREREQDSLSRSIAEEDARSRGDGTEPSVQWLAGLWSIAQQGIPVSAWLPESLAPLPRRTLDGFAQECRSVGGRVAQVLTRGPDYLPYALERDLASVLWEMPGAAGVLPAHRDAIDRVAGGQRAQPSVLHSAILDLIAAVAEDAPLLVRLEEPERYSSGALSALVSGLNAQAECPVLLLLAARDGVRPISPLCVAMPRDHAAGAPGSRGEGPRPR